MRSLEQGQEICNGLPVRLLYDAQIFEQQKYGGISRYFTELMRHLTGCDGFEYHLAIGNSRNMHLRELDDFSKARIPETLSYHSFLTKFRFPGKGPLFQAYKRRWERKHGNKSVLETALKNRRFDLFHPTYFGELTDIGRCPAPVVVTMYDMIHELYPEMVPLDRTSEHKKYAVACAEHVIAISESTKRDLVRLWGVPEEKITVVHLGSAMEAPQARLAEGDSLPGKYILFVGERAGYKNFALFLQAVSGILISIEALYLVVVGRPFSEAEAARIRELGIGGKVVHFSASDSLLPLYYAKASCFVFPSLYEGFGLPILEAMRCGCPMALSDSSSFREVGGDAAIYFDPTDRESMEIAIRSVVDEESLRGRLLDNGARRIGSFTWEATAKRTLSVYRQVVSSRSRR